MGFCLDVAWIVIAGRFVLCVCCVNKVVMGMGEEMSG